MKRIADEESMNKFLSELDKPMPNMPTKRVRQSTATPENYAAWAAMAGG